MAATCTVKLHDLYPWSAGNASLLLFRSWGVSSKLIRTAGRTEYSHAALLAWWDLTPVCMELREFRGGRVVTLESQVQRFPNRIDVYTIRPEWEDKFDRKSAIRVMLSKAGRQYSYAGIVNASLAHLPIVRLAYQPDFTDDGGPHSAPEYCSEAVANACRLGGGIDPVQNASDRITEPGDLAKSILWEPRFTLCP
jgi:hypothetical protein